MRHFSLLIFLMLSLSVFSQPEFMNSSTAIPPVRSGAVTAPLITAPNVFAPKTETKSSSRKIGEEKSDLMTHNNDFANPGERYINKLNKSVSQEGHGPQVPRKDVYLGDFKTKSAYIVVRYRDFGEVDGDMIRVALNEKVIGDQLMLEGEYKTIQINLYKGFNKFDFKALNEGLLSPNTGQFDIYDDQGKLISSNMWNLPEGFKGTFIVVKE